MISVEIRGEIRHLQEWNILFEDIDKRLKYVETAYKRS